MRHVAWWMGGLCVAAAAQGADLQISSLKEMSLNDLLEVDISTGTPKFLHQAPSVAYVITADDIARLGARNLQDVLESIPGLHVYLFQSLVNSPVVDMRGLVGDRGGYLLFLRDGKPLHLIGNNTMPEIFRLPVHFIERIEVARGPGSAVYGSDALAGTVNVITKKQPAEVGARGGQGSEAAAWAGSNGRAGPVDWSLAASRSRGTDPFEARNQNPPRTYRLDMEQEYTDLDLKLHAGGFAANAWVLNYGKVETGNPANPLRETTVFTQHRIADVSYTTPLTATTEVKVGALYTYFRGLRHAELLGGVPTDGDNGEERTTGDLTLTETRFAGHRLRLNVGATRERHATYFIPPPAPPPPPGAPPAPPAQAPAPVARDIRYASFQDEYAFAPDWELTAGARADQYQDIGTVHSPRLGLVWNVSPRLTAKVLQSRGFRAPPMAATNTTATNPESLRNTEAALDYRPNERWRAVINLYQYHARDLVVANGPTVPPVRRDGKGGEAELSWLASPQLKFESAVSYLSAHDADTGVRVPYTPSTSAKLAMNWRLRDDLNWHLRWEGYWNRARPPGDLRPPLDDFRLVHTTLRYELNANVALLFAAHNVFDDRSYVPVLGGPNPPDYQLPGRSVSLQAEVRF